MDKFKEHANCIGHANNLTGDDYDTPEKKELLLKILHDAWDF